MEDRMNVVDGCRLESPVVGEAVVEVPHIRPFQVLNPALAKPRRDKLGVHVAVIAERIIFQPAFQLLPHAEQVIYRQVFRIRPDVVKRVLPNRVFLLAKLVQ